MSNTEKNLQDAFAGESQANRKYLAFAKKADADGLPGVAKLFRAAAMAETIHAHNHLGALGGVGSSEENLKAAIDGETFEFQNMYPPMIEAAKAEGLEAAERSFVVANAVEKIHADLFTKAASNMKSDDADYHVCKYCGNTIESAPEGACSVCGAPKEAFEKIA